MSKDTIRKAYGILAITILFLICLGGAVRAMNAGLACPDWPLCFGDIIPDFHPQVFLEFIHRAVAGVEALVSFYVGFRLLRLKEISSSTKKMVIFSWTILIVQILMGALTVLKLLQSSIVVMHLALGLIFFCSLIWIYFDLSEEKQSKLDAKFLFPSLLLFFILFCQILLGGYVASSYSGLACYDFPTCNGMWLPPMVGQVGIQVSHRFGAYFCFLAVLAYLQWAKYQYKKQNVSESIFKNSRVLFSLILLQIAIGIANVKFLIPPLVTILHLLVASALLAVCLRNIHISIQRK